MTIEQHQGNTIQKWVIYPGGFCYYQTSGPAMTDWAREYSIEELTHMRDLDRIRSFEASLPPEISGFSELLELLLEEINKAEDPRKQHWASIQQHLAYVQGWRP